MPLRISLATLLMIALLSVVGCQRQVPPSSVYLDTANRSMGTLLVHSKGVITATDLSTNASQHFTIPPSDWLLSAGPRGQCFAVLLHAKKSGSEKLILFKEGRQTILFERPASAMRPSSLAMSYSGDFIAFVNGKRKITLKEPAKNFGVGELEIWSTRDGAHRIVPGEVFDSGISWLPDEKHILAVRLMPGGQEKLREGGDYYAYDFPRKQGDAMPWISEIDTATGKGTPTYPGLEPIATTDGMAMIASDGAGHFRWVAFSSGHGIGLPIRVKALAALNDGVAVLERRSDAEVEVYAYRVSDRTETTIASLQPKATPGVGFIPR